LIALLSADRADFVAALRNLARWPAVMMAIIEGETPHGTDLRQIAPNVLLSQKIADEQPAPWAQAIVVDERAAIPPVSLPTLVQRSAAKSTGRADCDRLQRDLAPRQFAGYLLTQGENGSRS
jgi:hypothetical protein